MNRRTAGNECRKIQNTRNTREIERRRNWETLFMPPNA